MHLSKSTSALFVADITISKEFYEKVLGMEVEFDFGGNVIYTSRFAIWAIQSDHVITQQLGIEAIQNTLANRFELYFETNDLQSVYSELKSQNVRFLHEIHNESWGQQTIRFFDPDNHLIEVGESMHRFVNRLHDEGLSVVQVSERTNMPQVEVERLLNLNN